LYVHHHCHAVVQVKFEGEGVDDYGGPYREIFQLVCDELQMPDPSSLIPTAGDGAPHGAAGAGRDSVPSTPLPAGAGTATGSVSVSGGATATPGPGDRTPASAGGHFTGPLATPSRPAPASAAAATAAAGADAYDSAKKPVRCFLPLLHPTPNWAATNGECAERYRYMFHPAAGSALRYI